MKAAHAIAAALALTSGMALAQADPTTSPYGARDPQQSERQADPTTGSRNVGDPMTTSSRNLGDPSATMSNNGDYLEACKQLGVQAKRDCLSQARRDRTAIESGGSPHGTSPHGDSMINRP